MQRKLIHLSDAEIACEFNKGSEEAFQEIYERYWLALFNHARRMIKNPERSADAVQDVFTKLLENKNKILLKETIQSFLFQNIRNHIINQITHEKVEQKYLSQLLTLEFDVTWNTDESIRQKELAAMILREIELLPPKTKETFLLSRAEQLSHREIAKQMNITENTVKKHVHTALKILRCKIMLLTAILTVVLHF